MPDQALRNIAIIAHVDHGKTTLVDQILKQANLFLKKDAFRDCFLDSNDLERERGITILSKNVSVEYRGTKINVIDTPGHSDFSGQVERVLNLADGALLLVDAADGPMPQTRFVLAKALELGLKCLVILNKIDRPDARPAAVHDKMFDLFVELNASDAQLDFPMLYASGKEGWASATLDGDRSSILPLMDAILEHIPAPRTQDGPVQMQVASIEHSDYVGRTGVGRVYRGSLDLKTPVVHMKRNREVAPVQLKQLFVFEGLSRRAVDRVSCGDLCAVVGIPDIDIGDTLADAESPEALPAIHMDEATLSMIFRINDSPFFGQDGVYVTSRHLRQRLLLEVQRDVALHVESLSDDSFNVSGRGVLHLSILIENMRREGFELTVAQPRVIYKDMDGQTCEPFELLTVDVPVAYAGKVIELVGARRGEIVRVEQQGDRRLQEFHIPTRGTLGLRSKLLTVTAGEAILHHSFVHYAPVVPEFGGRNKGSMISMGSGKAAAFAIDGLQMRGSLFVAPGKECYEGMIVGEHCLDSDLVVNIQKVKPFTNIRAAGRDRNTDIAPPVLLSLEEAIEYINDDELVEVTPKHVRLRKRLLQEFERKRVRRQAKV
jgi:GTP-binding protein